MHVPHMPRFAYLVLYSELFMIVPSNMQLQSFFIARQQNKTVVLCLTLFAKYNFCNNAYAMAAYTAYLDGKEKF